MSSGIYAYWDNIKKCYVYVGKDGKINEEKNRNYQHMLPSKYNQQQINRVLQNNPERYEYRVIMEGDYDDWELNKMEKLCIKSFKTYRYDYPNENVFNFTRGGDGFSAGEDHPDYIDLDENEIIKLYIDDRKSIRDIAKQFGVSNDVISRRLKDNDIIFRDNYSTNNKSYRDDLDDNLIIKLYVEDKKTTRDIANQLNTNHRTIQNRLKKNGIQLRKKICNNIPPSQKLLEEYLSQDITQKQLSEKYNCAESTINSRLKEARKKS